MPSTSARASAAAPALMCTAVPPAKSMRADAEALLHAVRDPAAVGEAAVVSEAEVEDPARDREVDDRRPHCREDHPRAELRPVGDGARDERDRDDRERRLEADEGERRVRGALRDLEQAGQADRRPVDGPGRGQALRGGERDGVAVQHPQDADEAHGAEAQHHHADDALRLDEPAVEERESGRHQQHECRRYQQERGVALIHLEPLSDAGVGETCAAKSHDGTFREGSCCVSRSLRHGPLM